MSTLEGTTMHPRCRQLFSTSQNTSQIQFRTFLKKKIKIDVDPQRDDDASPMST